MEKGVAIPQCMNPRNEGVCVCVCVCCNNRWESYFRDTFLSPFFISVNIVIFENIFICDTKSISTSGKNFIIKIPFGIEMDSEERRIGFYAIYICTSNAWFEKNCNRKIILIFLLNLASSWNSFLKCYVSRHTLYTGPTVYRLFRNHHAFAFLRDKSLSAGMTNTGRQTRSQRETERERERNQLLTDILCINIRFNWHVKMTSS